ncbi:UbiA family prenyltransferase [Nocardioides sp.]|uniref:UbiA family prenyltransferase n=1 Tax=Nocardioides sp. TaxID=35761 RepID=UPI002632AC8C|nr:UbiA family prenyltransferase [Nocardioides sp.]MDI6910962.1 UbiA family prenyltransferase [Nocardioides sp.]
MSPPLRHRFRRGAAADPDEPPGPESAAGPTREPAPAPDPAPAPEPDPGRAPTSEPRRRAERRRTLAHLTPVLLLRTAHPRQALLTATGLAVAAAISGRAGREVALVFATVLVGQAVLGWHNDLVDRRRDERRLPSGKPIADGYLDPGTVWFTLVCGVLLLVPLAISNGVTSGSVYLATIGVGLVANVVLRRSWFSWVPWAVAYAGYPAFLSYGGWGGEADGAPPQVAMVVLAAALGVGVHVLCALPGLVADHEDGLRHLPLRVALRIGATRLLVLALAWTVLALAGLLVVGNSVGLSR